MRNILCGPAGLAAGLILGAVGASWAAPTLGVGGYTLFLGRGEQVQIVCGTERQGADQTLRLIAQSSGTGGLTRCEGTGGSGGQGGAGGVGGTGGSGGQGGSGGLFFGNGGSGGRGGAAGSP
jgi:hypothetical protein